MAEPRNKTYCTVILISWQKEKRPSFILQILPLPVSSSHPITRVKAIWLHLLSAHVKRYEMRAQISGLLNYVDQDKNGWLYAQLSDVLQYRVSLLSSQTLHSPRRMTMTRTILIVVNQNNHSVQLCPWFTSILILTADMLMKYIYIKRIILKSSSHLYITLYLSFCRFFLIA